MMWFRLALALGMGVAECQRRVDAREFAEWMAFCRLEPFGEWRADLRAGIVACVVAQSMGGKGAKTFRPEDFMPKFGERGDRSQKAGDRRGRGKKSGVRRQSVREMQLRLRMAFKGFREEWERVKKGRG